MLWLAAQTSDSPFLTSPPSARGRVCQKLLDITIALLKPLIHGPPAGDTSATNGISSVINGVALGGLGVAMTGGDQRKSTLLPGLFSAKRLHILTHKTIFSEYLYSSNLYHASNLCLEKHADSIILKSPPMAEL